MLARSNFQVSTHHSLLKKRPFLHVDPLRLYIAASPVSRPDPRFLEALPEALPEVLTEAFTSPPVEVRGGWSRQRKSKRELQSVESGA